MRPHDDERYWADDRVAATSSQRTTTSIANYPAPDAPAQAVAGRRDDFRERLSYVIDLTLLGSALIAIRYIAIYLWLLGNGDVDEYRRYALEFWTTPPLFRSLPIEYPPLSILPFSLTLAPLGHDYGRAFAFCVALLALLGYLGFRRYADRRRAILYCIYLIIGTSGVLLWRFDLVPALATLAAFWAAQRRRFTLAYALIAVGILLKLYPIFLLPLIAITQWQSLTQPQGQLMNELPARSNGALVRPAQALQALRAIVLSLLPSLGLIGATYLVAFLLNPASVSTPFQYQAGRPFEVESFPATLLWLGTFLHIPAHPLGSFDSHNFVGPLDVVLEPLATLALIAGCLWVYWRLLRGKLSLAQAFTVCLCVVIATNKVFSPQYLIWILPFVAMLDELDPLWIVICLLSTLEYPILYQERHLWVLTSDWRFMLLLAIRNSLVVVAALRGILSRRQAKLGE